MNNIRIYAFFWMIVLLTVSCYEDKGNYDYHPINEVKISGIKEDPYEILRWDTLKIPVTLENSLNEKAKLIYAWYLDQKKIAETEDLCYVVSDKAKKYQARMEVTLPEDEPGMRWHLCCYPPGLLREYLSPSKSVYPRRALSDARPVWWKCSLLHIHDNERDTKT